MATGTPTGGVRKSVATPPSGAGHPTLPTPTASDATKSPAASGKKKIADTQSKMTNNFLKGLSGKSKAADLEKLLNMIDEAELKEDADTLRKCCTAITRVTGTDAGFWLLYKNGMLEVLSHVLEQVERVKLDVQVAYNAMVQQAAAWIATVDAIDFFKLDQVLELANRFAGEYRSVALSSVATLDRFTMQQVVHRKAILQAGGLHLIHRILSAHRSPEFCQETFVFLFHVCDIPPEGAKPALKKELSIINTICETLDQAPMNMRMQVAGLRVMSLWQNWNDPAIDKAMRDAGADATYRAARESLISAGFMHAASWIDAIAGSALEDKSGGKKKKGGGSKSDRSNASASNASVT